MSGPTAKELAARTDPFRAMVRGLVRRMVVTAHAAAAAWQVRGVRGADNSDEVYNAELFGGIGIASRPPASGSPEVIVLNVGGAKVPVIVATRDPKTAAAVIAAVGALQPGETLVCTAAGGAMLHLKPDGTIEARSTGGTAAALALEANLVALRTAIQNTVIVPNDGGAALRTAILNADWTTGTTKLKGE